MQSQHTQYSQLVDSLGIDFFLKGDAHDVENSLRKALRTNDLTKVKNKLAAEGLNYLEARLTKDNPAIVQEVKRRIFAHAVPFRYKLWSLADKISPSSEKDLLRLAGRGLATPYVEALHKTKPIPKRLLKPTTLACLVANAPKNTSRINELLKAGVFHAESVKLMLQDSIQKQDLQRVNSLLACWPTSEKFPSLHIPNLATAQLMPAGCVDTAVWGQVYYKNGDVTKAEGYLKQLDYYQCACLGELGINKGDYHWIHKCCDACVGSQATLFITVLERFRSAKKTDSYSKPERPAEYYKAMALELIGKWPQLLSAKAERDGVIRHILACADEQLTGFVLKWLSMQKHSFAASNKSFLLEIWSELGKTLPDKLLAFLQSFPEAHGVENWQKAWPIKETAKLKPLVLAAKRFEPNEASLLLLQIGSDSECIEHIFKETKALSLTLNDLLSAPTCLIKAAINHKLISQEIRFNWPDKSSVAKIKLLLGKRSPLYTLAAKLCAEERSYHEDVKDVLLAIAGHQIPFNRLFKSCAIDLGYLSDKEFKKRRKLATKAIVGQMTKCTPTQLAKSLSTILQESGAKEILRRWPTLKATPLKLQDTIIFSKQPHLFFDRATPKDLARLFVGLKDKGELIYRVAELDKWELLEQFCKIYPTLLAHKTDKYCSYGAKPEVSNRLIDLGFRITTKHFDDQLISRHIREKLWTARELNQLLITSIEQESGEVVAEIVQVSPDKSGPIFDLFRQGFLCLKPFNALTVARPLPQNIESIKNQLDELQKSAPPSKRVCGLIYAAPAHRWQVLTGKPAPAHKLRGESPYGFSIQGFKGIIGAAYHEALRSKTDFSQTLLPSYRLSVAFGNLDEVQKIIRKRNLPSKTPIHDFGQFNLPQKGTWDIGAWRKVLAHHSGKGLHILHLAPRIEAYLGRPPATLEEAEQTAVKCIYARATKFPELANLCHAYKRSEEQFEDYVRLLARAKKRDHCPDVKITLSDLGYDLERLAPGDPRGPLLGVITNCCQHLHGAAEECARAGVTHPDASFYIIKKNDRIVAQSFAWRTKTSLVFDSFETLSDDYDKLCLPSLKAAAIKALELDPSLLDVRLGTGGGTPTLEIPKTKPVNWVQDLHGMDSSSQYLLSQRIC